MTTGHKPQKQKESAVKPVEEGLSDPYQVLGLSRRATDAEIKQAYFAKVREFPPERQPEKFKQIRVAYDALRTPEARAATDLFLPNPPQPYQGYKRAPAFDLAFHEDDWLHLAKQQSDLGRTDFRDDFRDGDA